MKPREREHSKQRHALRALARSARHCRRRRRRRRDVVAFFSLPDRGTAAAAASSAARPWRTPQAALNQRRRDRRRRRRSVLECLALVAILDGGADGLLQRVRRQPLPANGIGLAGN